MAEQNVVLVDLLPDIELPPIGEEGKYMKPLLILACHLAADDQSYEGGNWSNLGQTCRIKSRRK